MGARGPQALSRANRIGAYEILGLLGSGATAAVYECRHEKLGRRAALKVLHPHLAREPIAAARFLREGRAVSRIVHPNVVEVFDVGEHEGLPFLVMTLVEGEDLAEYLRRSGPMSLVDAADSLLRISSAVAAAHDAKIIHRDLKPSNVRIARDHLGRFVPKVLDFGISKLAEDDQLAELTNTNGTLGTASYMAPEQLRSAKHVDARCDVYALGVILYECVAGRRPFSGLTGYELMHAVLTEPLKPPSAVRPGIPAEFDAVVMRAMRRDPSERFPSARAFALALAPFARDPAEWKVELAEVANSAPLPALPRGPGEEPSSTLASVSARHSGVRVVRSRAVIVAAVAWMLSVGLVVMMRAGRAAPSAVPAVPSSTAPLGSESSGRPSAGGLEPGLSSASAEEVSAPRDIPSSRAEPEPGGASQARRTQPGASRDHARPPAAPPPPARATSRVVAPGQETGSNGAPILE